MIITLNEPKGEGYKKLIDIAFEACDRFLFIKHSQLFYNRSVDIIIEELKDELICWREQNEWPGTISIPPARVYYFKTTQGAKEVILKNSSSLFEWQEPYLPDDLCFLKRNTAFLTTTSHENTAYIHTDDEDEVEKLKKIENLIRNIK